MEARSQLVGAWGKAKRAPDVDALVLPCGLASGTHRVYKFRNSF